MKDVQGVVSDIQRYSINDGPGIRTTVFMKGCPLRCGWCANPETQEMEPEYISDMVAGEKKIVGEWKTVGEVMNVVRRDKVFYEGSNGGVTLSGGEILMQPAFAKALIQKANDEGIHTTVETSGYASFETVWDVLKDVDLILYDLKGMDYKKHRMNTGVSNKRILENMVELLRRGKKLNVRIPVIPGQNATQYELQALVDFATSFGVQTIELLPYHRLGESKYGRLDRDYPWEGIAGMQREEVESLAKRILLPKNVELSVV